MCEATGVGPHRIRAAAVPKGREAQASRVPCFFITVKRARNVRSVACGAMDVVLVQWPAEAERLDALRAADVPRLLLVDNGSSPPEAEGCLEDWVRVPASEAEVHSRLAALSGRARSHRLDRPELDDDGVIRLGGAWVALPPVEARLASALLDKFGAVVGREALARAGWPAGAPGRNALDVHILRIRRRISPLGLAIRTVRSRGYLLETSERGQKSVGLA